MADLIFAAQFVTAQVGKTGLTVTVDVDRYTISDGSRTALVTGGAATEGRRGLYSYRLASADLALYQYIATFITTNTTVDQREIPALGLVVPDMLTSAVTAVVDYASVRTAVGLASANLDTQLAAKPTAAAIRTELSTELGRIDAAISSRLAAASYSAPPSASDNATAAAAAILATPANKLATRATGEASANVTMQAGVLIPGPLALEATAQAILEDTGTTLPAALAPAVLQALNSVVQAEWRSGETPDGALANLYDANARDMYSGGGIPTYWGSTYAAWVMLEHAGELFVGLGGPPMDCIAAVIGRFASVDADTVPEFEHALPEEGVMDILEGPDGSLYVVGVDERANTGVGSVYVRDTAGVWTRKATLPGFYHVLGADFDQGGRLWIAGEGSPSPVMYSTDGGDTWQETSFPIGMRSYDVIALSTAMIVTAWEPYGPSYSVHRSTSLGAFWGDVSGVTGGIARMVLWRDVVVGAGADGTLWTVNTGGTGTSYTPPFTPAFVANALVVDDDGYLCVLANDGSVWRTADLAAWRKVWTQDAGGPTIAALGKFQGQLVVATVGMDAALYMRPASPERVVERMTRDAMKLAPSAGAAEAGSVDAHLDDILEDTGTTLPGLIVGSGTYSYSNTVDDGSGNLLDGVRVELATDIGFTNIVSATHTDSEGAFTVYSDLAGTHYLRLQLAGYAFTIQTVVLA